MNKEKVSDLRSHLGFWLRLVSNHVSYSFARKIEAQSVTVAEWVMMREMYEHEDKTSPSSLIKQTGLTKGAVSKLIERLCVKKLAIRLPVKHDKRFQEIGLTERGRDLVPKLAGLADANDKDFFGCLTAKEHAELERILKKIVSENKLNRTPIN